jgi:uncharacterized protein YdeI (YjbR/CyaY-like superfamily)
MDRIEPKTLAEWRTWLEVNHLQSTEIWLVISKAGRAVSGLRLNDAVDEAICFGWIDSRGKRLDEDRFMLRLTPRKNVKNWSQRNLRRANDLIEKGRMTEAGISKLPSDFRASIIPPDLSGEENIPPEFERSMKEDPEVWNAFLRLTPGRRREFVRWVSGAKRPETRQKRLIRTIELVRMGRSLTGDMMQRWSDKRS